MDLKLFDANAMSLAIFSKEYDEIKHSIYPSPSYKCFFITKKNGDPRKLFSPRKDLKNLQKNLLDYIYTLYKNPKDCVHGFSKGRSVVTNANAHFSDSTHFILNIDLKDFFPSISYYRVRGVFESHPFYMARNIASILAQICCFNGSLVQGAPTSPILSNLICRSLDKQLINLSNKYRIKYTRYCDDITFSFRSNTRENLPAGICKFDGDKLTLGEELQEIIKSNGFEINEEKTRLSSRDRRMEVTGIIINKFPNVSRRYIDEIRGALNAWKKHGYDSADAVWKEKKNPRNYRSQNRQQLHRYIYGKLLYLGMVKGRADQVYTKLAELYNELLLNLDLEEKYFLKITNIVQGESQFDKSVFVIESRFGKCELGLPKDIIQGTVFCIQGGRLVTCSHVVNHVDQDINSLEKTYYLIEPTTQNEFKLNLIKHDPHKDLAILEFSEQKPSFIKEIEISPIPPRQDDRIYLLGFPNWTKGRPLTKVKADISSVFNKSGISKFEISNLIRTGNSGGPILNSKFQLLGIAIEGASVNKGNNECVSTSELNKFI